jgi:glucose-6-phosphate isomerase
MESNGKQVNRDGETVDFNTSPIIWGSAGTNGQHSFHQLLHQGTRLVPVDFILPLSSHYNTDQHQLLVANCLAQAEALMDGQDKTAIKRALLAGGMTADDATLMAAHQHTPGNRPSTIITMDNLNPSALGALIALYEHKVFCSSVIWGINAFDQWGVELGKSISSKIHSSLNNAQDRPHNPATAASVSEYIQNRNKASKP